MALQRLTSRGYEAYLVGGCVRDLLLGRQPKDFDIATEARPQQVKRTFPRNCRIIGRRFKLAHLHFNEGRKILELSTFRRAPEGLSNDDQDLLITRDNEFGNAEEDARRRDFTVNALFLDPLKDRIIDYVGGLHDVQSRVLRTIGTPIVRFREDPVRILRAAKFAGRLGLSLEPDTIEAMASVAPDLVRSAAPRILEEILRLLRGGHALDSFQILRDIGALRVILPIVGGFLRDAPEAERVVFWRMLEELDARVLQDEVPPTAVLLGVLFARPIQAAIEHQPDRSPAAVTESLLGTFGAELRLSRRDAGGLKRICSLQGRFLSARGRPSALPRDPFFAEALQLFSLSVAATGQHEETLAEWIARRAERGTGGDGEDAGGDDEMGGVEDEARLDEPGPGRRKRRRRRRRRRGGEAGPGEIADRAERDAAEEDRDDEPRAPEPADQLDLPFPVPAGAREAGASSTGAANGDGEGRRRKRRRGRRGRGRKGREAAGEPVAAAESVAAPAAEPAPRRAEPAKPRPEPKGGGKRARGERARDRRGGRKHDGHRDRTVETLEPEAIDLSMFDRELDPRRVPSFGVLVDESANKRRRRGPRPEEDDYRPPPPPGSEPAPPAPKPPPDDESFGDW